MRLLRTQQYELLEEKDFPGQCPPYAILSHTWISAKEEITYQDLKTRRQDIDNGIYKQRGWAKVKQYCDRAWRDGWKFAWMDTCCIDKANAADTQEAINAMFRWYQNAVVCYAHFEDVDVNRSVLEADRIDLDVPESGDLDDRPGTIQIADQGNVLRRAIAPSLVQAKWFTRGWTLQELLAPHYLIFVDQSWRRIGTRECWAPEIREACGIEAKQLISFDPTDFVSCSIAMRLSWASRRSTTVEEDESYSLLGLFGVSLPLIYGEGRWRAFNRLQRELIMTYNDDSIFAWTFKSPRTSLNAPGNQNSKSFCKCKELSSWPN
ncbi:Vegetative incompatibility protein HET-E-1 [Cyphellophora attinorum]|uniref:Vegetative incompatibility protein HET-E-1 n=1 Tax=Cyphellophora attinorum TaxID=1664694 RepID=A0A0N1P220_9EURO|nr:Vegetative incompatibility protein HET-E-1 [Phialophora attinorum]KPI45802.1 Vegetative incompatibility protein HET-E-1 [Phialophora attinorum]